MTAEHPSIYVNAACDCFLWKLGPERGKLSRYGNNWLKIYEGHGGIIDKIFERYFYTLSLDGK